MKLVKERDPLARLLAFVYAPLALVVWWLIDHQIMVDVTSVACPLLKHTGIACPTCGGTRAGLALGRLDPLGAWLENPLITVGLLVLGMWFAYAMVATLVKGLRFNLRVATGESRVIRLVFTALIVGTWIYEIKRHAG